MRTDVVTADLEGPASADRSMGGPLDMPDRHREDLAEVTVRCDDESPQHELLPHCCTRSTGPTVTTLLGVASPPPRREDEQLTRTTRSDDR